MHIYLSLLLIVILVFSKKKEEIMNNDGSPLCFISENYKFITVFLILSMITFFRKNIGIDYTAYVDNIINMHKGYPNYMEFGFVNLSKFLMLLTNEPRIVIGIFGVITQFLFIKAFFDQSKDQQMSIVLYLTWGYYFYTFNSIRYYLALSICIYSVKHLVRKKYVKFFMLVLLASTFHKSALLCIPIYFIAKCSFGKREYFLIVVFFLLSWFFRDEARRIIFLIYPSYEGSVYDDFSISWLNVIRSFCVFVFTQMMRTENDELINIYKNLNFFALLLYTFAFWIPETSRIGYFLNFGSVILIPNLLVNFDAKNRKYMRVVIYLLSVTLFIVLMLGFYSPTIKLLPYQSWI